MPKKNLPYFFLFFLFIILVFILGVRYGQKVERTNKTISYLLKISPTATPKPTLPPLAFHTYNHVGCAVSFLVPNLIEKTKESSTSALFSTQSKTLALAIMCEKKPLIQEKDEKIGILNGIRTFIVETKGAISYRFYNPQNALIVTLTASKEYDSLVQKSFSLLK